MTGVEIPAHELDFPNPRDELELIEEGIQVGIENLARVRDNLGVTFDDVLSVLGFRVALKCPRGEIVNSLGAVCEFRLLQFCDLLSSQVVI